MESAIIGWYQGNIAPRIAKMLNLLLYRNIACSILSTAGVSRDILIVYFLLLQTIVLVPVIPLGVVQLGSLDVVRPY